jgi:hypothetical protein
MASTKPNAEPAKNEPAESAPACSNHPDRPAVLSTDGIKHAVLHFCAECEAVYEKTRPKGRGV